MCLNKRQTQSPPTSCAQLSTLKPTFLWMVLAKQHWVHFWEGRLSILLKTQWQTKEGERWQLSSAFLLNSTRLPSVLVMNYWNVLWLVRTTNSAQEMQSTVVGVSSVSRGEAHKPNALRSGPRESLSSTDYPVWVDTGYNLIFFPHSRKWTRYQLKSSFQR